MKTATGRADGGARTPALGWRHAALGIMALAVVAAACSGALPNPRSDANQGQMMIDLADAMNGMREQSASLQEQVDSLRDVLARQDTLLRQLAANAGIPVKPQ